MRRLRSVFCSALPLILCFVLCLSLAPISAAPEASLAREIESVTTGPDYLHAHWGLLCADLQTGETVYALNPDQLFSPASTTKLYSTAAALTTLGADHRFKTPVHRRGEVDGEGRLAGDLILVASGDLTMGGRTDGDGRIAFRDSDHTYANGNETAELTDPDPLAGLNDLARQVAAAGIRRVTGAIVVDERLFDRAESTGSGPARLSPILINDNVIDVLIAPADSGEPARVTIRPESSAVQVDARVTTVEKAGDTRVTVVPAGGNRLVVRGQVPAGRKPLLRVVEVEDPALFARALFIEALRREGVATEASPLDRSAGAALPPGDRLRVLPVVATLTSPPFSDSVRLILKVSHNLHASTLPLLLGARQGKRSLDDGLHAQRDALARLGVDVDAISFGGGAGGSRADLTTPRATVQLLRQMAARPDFPVFEAALPVLGVDGTLSSAVDRDSPARGKVRAKTGTYTVWNTLNDRLLLTSKALAGYLTTAKGRRLAFAIFVNNTHLRKPATSAREGRTLGRLCEILFRAE